jgi:hypothetical protein
MRGTEKKLVAMLFSLCTVAMLISATPISPGLASGVEQPIPRIAVVKPVFSATAYSSAFYVFYQRYGSSNETYIQTDLNLLNVTVKDAWGWSNQLYNFITSEKARRHGLLLGETFTIIDEINVTDGGLFRNGKRVYNALILGFTEYVTQREYNAYRKFVASGGTLVIMDACNFLAEVEYYPPTSPGLPSYLSLVKGHGWEFNGTHAWKSVYHRWPDENKNWIGSNYWHWWYGKHYDKFIANTTNPISQYLNSAYGSEIPTPYSAHEENLLQNLTGTEIIGYWHLIDPGECPKEPIVAYQHGYVNGTVFHTGIMASDIIGTDSCMQSFLLGALGALSETDGKQLEPNLAIGTMYVLSAVAVVAVIILVFSICNIRVQKESERHKPRDRAPRVQKLT